MMNKAHYSRLLFYYF